MYSVEVWKYGRTTVYFAMFSTNLRLAGNSERDVAIVASLMPSVNRWNCSDGLRGSAVKLIRSNGCRASAYGYLRMSLLLRPHI